MVAADNGVADEWDRWARQEPNALAVTYDQLASNPIQLSSRQKRLVGKTYGTGTYEGTTFIAGSTRSPLVGGCSTSSGGRAKPVRQARRPKLRRRVIIETVHPGQPSGSEAEGLPALVGRLGATSYPAQTMRGVRARALRQTVQQSNLRAVAREWVEVARSARRHGLNDDAIRHAYRLAVKVVGGDDGLTMVIGPTPAGQLIEIGFVEAADAEGDAVVVIVHAMPARPKYLR